MAYATVNNQVAALKELYDNPSEFMQDLVYKENVLLSLLPKDEAVDGFSGKYIPVPIVYGHGQGRSHNFSLAQANQTANVVQSFFVYRVSDYQIVTIANELLEATKSQAGAFIDQAKFQVDAGIRNISQNVNQELYGNGTGARGTIGSGALVSGTTYSITLSNVNDIVKFEIGMTLVNFAISSNTVAITASITGVVDSVNRASGVITVISSATSSSWTTAGQFLAVQGDAINGAINTGTSLCLSGLAAWLPKVSPSSTDNFWGVNRSVDPTRLAGLRYDASAFTMEEGLINALAFMNREGAKPDLIVMDFASYASLINQIGAKVQYVQVKHDEAEFGFQAVQLVTAYGAIPVTADKDCSPNTAYALTLNTWKLRSLGKMPQILRYGMEGLEGLRVGNADALEVRIGYYGNLVCNAPGRNMVVTLSSS